MHAEPLIGSCLVLDCSEMIRPSAEFQLTGGAQGLHKAQTSAASVSMTLYVELLCFLLLAEKSS